MQNPCYMLCFFLLGQNLFKMSEQEILEGNTLIAEFEGLPFVPYKRNRSIDKKFNTYKECQKYIEKNKLEGFIPELWWNQKSGQYDHNFQQLMRAVEKITKTKYDDGDNAYLRTFGMLNKDGNVMVRINRCPLFEAPTLIEATWLAVVDWCRTA